MRGTSNEKMTLHERSHSRKPSETLAASLRPSHAAAMKVSGRLLAVLMVCASACAQAPLGNEQFRDYLRDETMRLSEACLSEINSLTDWNSRRDEYRRQLQEMLGLWPLPLRTDLKPVVTGTVDHPEFTVEKLHFQAMPGLYCTAALFIPKGITAPAPAILYECGHWQSVTNGISYGNKAAYQADGAWYARNGYVCMVLDTVLAGEIRGIHTGTRDRGLWWWNSRGYTPAGVEAWFGIRALDFLSTRVEVDTNRFGITGHSGGGAYSWMVTALDDRIKAAAPLAGMADIRSHILDPIMDSHCDCNFFVNYYGWDFPQVAALAAPRPLLLGGTDNDRLFNLPNTLRIHDQLRRIYQIHNATSQLGLIIAPGGHDETPELQVAVMRWFDRHLKGAQRPVENAATRFFAPQELKVFATLPADSINTNIALTFGPVAGSALPAGADLRSVLVTKVFSGWPKGRDPLNLHQAFSGEREGLRLSAWDFTSQRNVRLRIYRLDASATSVRSNITLSVLDESGWTNAIARLGGLFGRELTNELRGAVVEGSQISLDSLKEQVQRSSLMFFAPRGVGLDAWAGDERAHSRIRRRFMLLGQTRDSMRVWDIRRAVQVVRELNAGIEVQVILRASSEMGVNTLYAALFEPSVRTLQLGPLPQSHIYGPDYLGILRVCDIPQVVNAVKAHARIEGEPSP